jgi:cytoplasmic iron level regulating protein YaaA (DUF328/UPF0246 family)
MAKVVIITEESGVKLPVMNRWKKQLGKGEKIDKIPGLIAILKKNNLPIPSDDREFESQYREVLTDYIRPAHLMFAGRFSEVKQFKDKIDSLLSPRLYIISGRYGLLDESDEIVPYVFNLDSNEKLVKLNKSFQLCEKIIDVTRNADYAIFCLPTTLLAFFASNNLFEKVRVKKSLIIIGSTQFEKQYRNNQKILFLPRKGVARMGKTNQERIMKIISQYRGC